MTNQARLQIALDDHRAGRLPQAIAGYRDVLRSEREDATAQAMLGVALAQSGAPGEGLKHLERSAALAPDDAGLLENLGACFYQLGSRVAAGVTYLRSAALATGSGNALAAAGASFIAMKALPGALRCLRRALAVSPAEAKWWVVAGEGVLDSRRPDAAIACFRRALDLGFDNGHLVNRLADALTRIDRVEQAAMLFEGTMARTRASRWYRPELAAGAGPASGSDSFLVTSVPKLRHDILQFEYLMRRGILSSSFAEMVDRYRALLSGSAGRAVDGPCFFMTEAERKPIEETYNRIVHLYRAKPVGPDVLGRSVDWASAERRYVESGAGILVVDDVLSDEALIELRRLCLESTIWFDDRHLGGYLGALLRDGFCDPLLLRISRELARRMPAVFHEHALAQMWAYKYDSGLEGTALHADSAAINVNFWITPDEANLSKDRGGLIVFDQRAPAEWEFEKYNNDQPAIRQFLAESGARSVVVPYRCNRVVIFHSDLFHRTDDLAFKDDYESRRINITMLFGGRGE
ncbi:MAG: tetratricopeptide repeat protein [Alphaproteobacteria bacterium]|nr:tetratricopeptide repeat protein [Alphaproteobacteria bacterium]